MSIDGPGLERLRTLAVRLKDAGAEGKGLQRELRKALKDAADPLAKKIGDEAHLDPYMPNRYAAVLASDLQVKVYTSLSGDPSVTIRAQAVAHKRKIRQLNDGRINHPVYAQGPRRRWHWNKIPQTRGMRAGFFSDPCEAAAPDVRDKLLRAMRETDRKIAGDG